MASPDLALLRAGVIPAGPIYPAMVGSATACCALRQLAGACYNQCLLNR